jgi:hypothetical protein
LEHDFSDALEEIEETLLQFSVPITEIIGSGGGETKGTQRLRRSFDAVGWKKTNFEIIKTINGKRRQSITHEIDHVKVFGESVLALEIEWNNKDPFFDRDLENFSRLHSEGAISVGIIVTRGPDLQANMEPYALRFASENMIGDFSDLDRLSITQTAKQKQAVIRSTTRRRNPLSFPEAWAHKFVADKYGKATTHWEKLMSRIEREVGSPCPLLLIGLPASVVTFPEASGNVLATEIAEARELSEQLEVEETDENQSD